MMASGSFLGIQQPEHGADHPLPSTAKGANGLKLHILLPTVPT